MSEEPRGSPLHDQYRRLVHDASERGLVPEGGRTPRELEDDLKQVEDLPANEVEALRDVVERCVYGPERDDRKVGIRLCAKLLEAVRRFPVVRRATGTAEPRRRGTVPDEIVGAFVLLLVGALIFFGARGGGGGGAAYGSPTTNRTWGNATEFRALADAEGGWSNAPPNPTVHDVDVPEYTRSTGSEYKAGLDLDTGTDHRFRGFRDPFDPPLEHHHRLSVFTAIDEDFRFLRLEEPLVETSWKADPGAGTLYELDFRTEVSTAKPFLVPTPTPGAILLGWSVRPARWNHVLHRGPGDTLWLDSAATGSHRIEMTFRSPDDYHLAALPETPTEELRFSPMPLPENVRRSADEVIGFIGKIPGPTYRATVRRLHSYFNGFTVAPIKPRERRRDDYLTVALARKGVCRHRAQTFVITANAAGIPARLVTNELHAFAEVELPDGGWRMLEFRLSGRDWRPAVSPPPADPWQISIRLAGLIGLVFVLVLLAAAHRRDGSEHRIDAGRRASRAHRRAERDADRARGRMVVMRLLNLVRYRLGVRLGVSPDDREAIRVQLEAAAPTVVPHWRTLTEIYRTRGADQGSGRYGLADAYWAAKSLLVWARKEE